MRLAHKRKVQKKLQKRIQAMRVTLARSESQVNSPVKSVVIAQPQKVESVSKTVSKDVALTPKQQQVLDIVARFSDGINPKSIGLEAGQDDSKAASWATGALKKLLDENLVEKVQLAGNKVLYKSL
ncbi:MarR family transcriptional regulator [Vibrio viridaestus]|uniref:MarR family transcriptional regulator n=1 Tax=Vibrio viridaestus TaxID=2487322 RepID=A0A3N9TGR7_9VIBR|nr:MarR family transcriptional regulator [Vibrio viridaestus]RQW63477.1 MarR family transcriptional regulator [Vibrio viridaestus]